MNVDSGNATKSEQMSVQIKEQSGKDPNSVTATTQFVNVNKSFNTVNDIKTVMSIYNKNGGKARPMPLPKDYHP